MSKHYHNKPESKTEEIVEPVSEEVEEAPKLMYGKIVNCDQLNVRSDAAPAAPILGRVTEGETVKIIMDESNSEFYKVVTEAGMEGYCMCKYVAVQ